MKNKQYDVCLPFGNTTKTIPEMDRTDIYFIGEKDKNELLWELIEYYKEKEVNNV